MENLGLTLKNSDKAIEVTENTEREKEHLSFEDYSIR
jgi:hypothetical protein